MTLKEASCEALDKSRQMIRPDSLCDDVNLAIVRFDERTCSEHRKYDNGSQNIRNSKCETLEGSGSGRDFSHHTCHDIQRQMISRSHRNTDGLKDITLNIQRDTNERESDSDKEKDCSNSADAVIGDDVAGDFHLSLSVWSSYCRLSVVMRLLCEVLQDYASMTSMTSEPTMKAAPSNSVRSIESQ